MLVSTEDEKIMQKDLLYRYEFWPDSGWVNLMLESLVRLGYRIIPPERSK